MGESKPQGHVGPLTIIAAFAGLGLFIWLLPSIFNSRTPTSSAAPAKPMSTPASAPAVPAESLSARIERGKAQTPELGKLVADVRAVAPRLQKMIDEGSLRDRNSSACVSGLSQRLTEVNAMDRTLIGDPAHWAMWSEPQTNLAGDLDDVVVEIRSCVNCSMDDKPACGKAAAALKKLTRRLARGGADLPD